MSCPCTKNILHIPTNLVGTSCAPAVVVFLMTLQNSILSCIPMTLCAICAFLKMPISYSIFHAASIFSINILDQNHVLINKLGIMQDKCILLCHVCHNQLSKDYQPLGSTCKF